jgi:hypothetical protein
MLDLNVAVFHPSEGRKPFSKGSHTGLHLWVALSEPVQERHAPHAVGLLRTRHERPSCRRAPEASDELAPFHSITSSARAS